jgi:hypothetical protein
MRPLLRAPVLALVLVGCAAKPAETARSWEVFKGSELVLSVADGPGPLLSAAAPPPGASPVLHPFLSASARAPAEEDALKSLLDASKSTEDFLARLRAAGYVVKPSVH